MGLLRAGMNDVPIKYGDWGVEPGVRPSVHSRWASRQSRYCAIQRCHSNLSERQDHCYLLCALVPY